MAVEVIEHLENPWHLARECCRALRPGGHLFVTTPNINNAASKAMLVRFGFQAQFNVEYYRRIGHITPVSYIQMQLAAEEARLEVVQMRTFADPLDQARGHPRLIMLARLLHALTVQEKWLAGSVLIGTFRKPLTPMA